MEATEVEKLAALEDRHWWYRERRIILRRMSEDAFPAGAAGRVAVDVGAAGGGNCRVLRDLGMAPLAVEFGRAGAVVARHRGLTVLQGDARRLPLSDASADLVVAFDVLEHIEEEDIVLREVVRVLRPGGWLFLAVPADMDLWSAHDDAVGHVRRYSRKHLSTVVEGAGLRIQSVRSWNVILRPVVALRRRNAQGSDLSEVHPLVNLALRGVIAAERRLPWLHRRRGVSLMLTARGPEA